MSSCLGGLWPAARRRRHGDPDNPQVTWVAVGEDVARRALISSINKTFDFSRGSQAKYYVYTELWGVYSELERLKRDIPYIT